MYEYLRREQPCTTAVDRLLTGLPPYSLHHVGASVGTALMPHHLCLYPLMGIIANAVLVHTTAVLIRSFSGWYTGTLSWHEFIPVVRYS